MTKVQKYELALIFQADLGEKEIANQLDEIKADLKKADVAITMEDFWGLRNFAYNLKSKDKGFYVSLYLDAQNGEFAKEITHDLNINKAVIRSLLIKIPDFYKPGKAAEFQKKTEELISKLEDDQKEESSKLQEELQKITGAK